MELLAKRQGGRLDDRGREFLRFAVDGSVRMGHLIDSLLAYAQIGAAQRAFDRVATCRLIVERLGGSIAVDSKPGEGAVFRVVLPKAMAARATG